MKNKVVTTEKYKYQSEEELSKEFCAILESDKCPWGKVNITREFNYPSGRTDILALDLKNNIIAFELKLNKLTIALQQAYRNTSFAHCSYVVIPSSKVNRAKARLDEFKKRSVGLCSLGGGEIQVSLPAIHQEPIQQWLNEKAANIIDKENSNTNER
jgi:hypothetical protein